MLVEIKFSGTTANHQIKFSAKTASYTQWGVCQYYYYTVWDELFLSLEPSTEHYISLGMYILQLW